MFVDWLVGRWVFLVDVENLSSRSHAYDIRCLLMLLLLWDLETWSMDGGRLASLSASWLVGGIIVIFVITRLFRRNQRWWYRWILTSVQIKLIQHLRQDGTTTTTIKLLMLEIFLFWGKGFCSEYVFTIIRILFDFDKCTMKFKYILNSPKLFGVFILTKKVVLPNSSLGH